MDIVERLRKLEHAGQPIPTAEDAADEIERLRVELVESGEMLFNQANTIHEMQAERDALKQKLVEEDLIPIRVSVHGMYDCHLFHRYSGGSPKELANAWIEHNRKPHLRRHQEDGPAHEMGPTCLGPAIVLGSKREFRRVGKMVYARGEYPDVTYDTADLAAWVRALEDDPDITRLLQCEGE